MHPADHISQEISQLPWRTSGEIQYGVPALVFMRLSPVLEMILERPKSMILRSASSAQSAKRKFSGFKSRWQIPSLWQQFNAIRIYLKIFAACYSLKNSAAMILSKSSPPAQSLQVLKCVSQLKIDLLCDQVDVLVVFKVLVELNNVGVILYKARLVVGMAFVRTRVECVSTYQRLEDLDLSEEPVPVLDLGSGNGLDGPLLTSFSMCS